jgi:hypothetical protein
VGHRFKTLYLILGSLVLNYPVGHHVRNTSPQYHQTYVAIVAMAQTLHPLPHPGLSVYPGFTATKPETFLAKCRNAWSDRASYLISYSSPNGKPLNPFMEIVEEKRNNISFKTMNGQEVMRIIKQEHTWSGAEYHGMRGEGNEVWHLQLKGNWSTEYRTLCAKYSVGCMLRYMQIYNCTARRRRINLLWRTNFSAPTKGCC